VCISSINELGGLGGTYILILRLKNQVRVKVGSLGLVNLPAGYYAYVGSARGGFRARVGRHLKLTLLKEGRLRWHIDYLLMEDSTIVHGIVYVKEAFIEHELAKALAKGSGIEAAVLGFGSTDCGCPTHLFRISNEQDPEGLVSLVVRGMGYTANVILCSP
jgi:Uncharacterized conserved protein